MLTVSTKRSIVRDGEFVTITTSQHATYKIFKHKKTRNMKRIADMTKEERMHEIERLELELNKDEMEIIQKNKRIVELCILAAEDEKGDIEGNVE